MKLPKITGLALLAGISLGACAHNPGHSSAEDDQTADEASAELREYHRHHHRGGVTQFIAMSLDTINEDDAQRSEIEKLHTKLDDCMAPTRDVENKLVLTYADGVSSGAIDGKQFEKFIVELNSTSAATYECSADALNRLHVLLTPSEREVVADKVQAHWEIWREVNDGNDIGTRERGGHLTDLTEDLELTPEQVDRATKALTVAFDGNKFESKKAEGHVLAFAAAFVFPKFDARSITPEEPGRLSAPGARHMALFYETITPILQPAQRVTLAEQLREHANHTTHLSAN